MRAAAEGDFSRKLFGRSSPFTKLSSDSGVTREIAATEARASILSGIWGMRD